MTSDHAFDLYSLPKATTPASRKKESRWHPGESSRDPSKNRARTEDPPALVPSKENTPPPAPIDQTLPLAPVDQTPPPALVDSTPPDQSGNTQREAIMNIAFNSANDKLKKLSRHRCNREAISNTSSMKVDQIFSRGLNEVLSGVLTMSTSWRPLEAMAAEYAKESKAVEERLGEQLKVAEAKHAEQLKASEEKIFEQLRAAKEKNTKLGEELKQFKDALDKFTKSKERYKESSLINFKEASKLQDELATNRKETAELEKRVKLLEETNVSDLERFKGAAFNCFYMFWKNNREANFDYLPERMKQAEMEKCVACLEEEEKVQASPEISLAMGIDGIDEDTGTSINQ
ncbi:uncharacterized protein LOC133814520 [Humulus lupulus]|uniref:uncharacterized protein LOC133814520 n=1 Tax=Humulus lupulus TaxID=3486 RepID=UPI002B41156D|nr:uncharacterized protein LOC133814520 [Humulus lupulus]